ncbi:hypothetical protein DFJ43DRAFT_721448 [Lentinula guzmanii]|uniref:Uncharacterized protein n=1 Tax=Lentinula guzmanii TaxID=2804957 RepID=A0AA38MWK6_9AGAR|nr:hypothetical protein DFJ43DRAFT_721448 [Lentinula guzmanii]
MKKLFVPLHFMLCTLEFQPAKKTIVNLSGSSKSLWSQYCLPLGQGWKNPSRPEPTSFLLVIRLLEYNAISCTQSSIFGSCCVPNTLKRPWKKQRSMLTDYGGTEIASALSLVYSSLPKPLVLPVAVILLTDGSAWDVSTCVSHTQTALSTLPHSAPDSFISVVHGGHQRQSVFGYL